MRASDRVNSPSRQRTPVAGKSLQLTSSTSSVQEANQLSSEAISEPEDLTRVATPRLSFEVRVQVDLDVDEALRQDAQKSRVVGRGSPEQMRDCSQAQAEDQIAFQDLRRMDGIGTISGLTQYLEEFPNPFFVLDSLEGLLLESYMPDVEEISKLKQLLLEEVKASLAVDYDEKQIQNCTGRGTSSLIKDNTFEISNDAQNKELYYLKHDFFATQESSL